MISDNLARANVPGARSGGVAFTVLEPTDTSEMPEMVKNGVFSLPITARNYIDYSQAPLEATGSPFNLALQSRNAFLSVKMADGKEILTRNGDFSRTATGRMVQNDGSEMLLEDGGTLNLSTVKDLKITETGDISGDGVSMGRVKIVRVNNPQEELNALSGSRFVPKEGVKTVPGLGADDRLEQGYLEKGNTASMEQMVQMMSVMRSYEANQKMITTQDDTMGKLISSVIE